NMDLHRGDVVAFGRSTSLVKQIDRIGGGDQPVVAIRNTGDIDVLVGECPRIYVRPTDRDSLRVNLIAIRVRLGRSGMLQRSVHHQIISDAETDLLVGSQHRGSDRAVRSEVAKLVT